VLDYADHSAFESTLNSSIVSYRVSITVCCCCCCCCCWRMVTTLALGTLQTFYYFFISFVHCLAFCQVHSIKRIWWCEAYGDDGAEVSPPDAAAAEESAGEDEGADCVERDADRVDRNVDETWVAGRLGRDDNTERNQRQTSKLQFNNGHSCTRKIRQTDTPTISIYDTRQLMAYNFNHLTSTVAIRVQLKSILCQTGLGRHL